MSVALLRLFIFTAFPLLLAWGLILIDRSADSRERKLELLLIFLFAVSVAGSGISNFFAHFFMADMVAEFIGWAPGSPFQLEVAFANLALGVLGIVAVGRRDGFREATVMAVTIFALGASVVHVMDIVATGNLAPGNSLQIVLNLLRPALLIWALRASRQAEAAPQPEAGTVAFEQWRMPLVQSTAPLTIAVSTAYGLGFAVGQPWLLTLLGAIVGVGIVVAALGRSPLHELSWRQRGKMIGMQCIQAMRSSIQPLLSARDAPLFIALDGGSGSGKSTIAGEFQRQIDCALIRFDDFYNTTIPETMWPRYTIQERLRHVFDWGAVRRSAIIPLRQRAPAPPLRHQDIVVDLPDLSPEDNEQLAGAVRDLVGALEGMQGMVGHSPAYRSMALRLFGEFLGERLSEQEFRAILEAGEGS